MEQRPITDSGRLAHAELHRFAHTTATPCPGPLCPHQKLVIAIEREARAASASVPPLDVERLARALIRHEGQHDDFVDEHCGDACADEIAAAYAAETPEQDR